MGAGGIEPPRARRLLVYSQVPYRSVKLSIDNAFRAEYAYVDYRRWGVVEVWNAGRYATAPPRHQRREDRIEVWRDWKLVAACASAAEAQRLVDLHLADAPVRLDDLRHYLAVYAQGETRVRRHL